MATEDPSRTVSASKREALQRELSGEGGLLVAFSGGVDSTALLHAAMQAHEGRVLAVTVSSSLLTDSEVSRAIELAQQLDAEHRTLALDPLADPDVRSNPPRRCYFCKRLIFQALTDLAREEGLESVVDGSNVDDSADYRPGQQALAELGTSSPLRDAGLTKADVRSLARDANLPNWNAPAAACLASRVPYGEPLTLERLHRIEAGEVALKAAGYRQVRLRDHGALARIEVPPEAIETLANPARRAAIVTALEAVGYTWIALDLVGYRTGAMNEVLNTEVSSTASTDHDSTDKAPVES